MSHALHPQVEALLAGVLKAATPARPPTGDGIRQANANLSSTLVGPGEPVAFTWEGRAETRHGSVPLRWYVPELCRSSELLVYVHGGGWVAGTLDSYDTLCRALALRTGAIVMSVGYSLSPEAVHPVALEEVIAVFKQARSLVSSAGYNIQKVTIAGDSAGGHLAAAALHVLLSTGSEMPDALVLIYPVLDASMDFQSHRRFATGYHLTTDRLRWYWEQYLGRELSDEAAILSTPEISPLRSNQLPRFPPTMIVTAAFDPLRDEGLALAKRLAAASVPVQYLEIPGQIHGFLRFRKVLTDPLWGPDAVMTRMGTFLREIGC
jgi:acetyl esterase